MAHILIVDDDALFNKMLKTAVAMKGYNVLQAHTLTQGLELAEEQEMDVIFLDVRLPDGNGLKAIPQFMESPGHPEIIIVTGEGDADGAELAINSGAWDYIQKPSSLDKITLPLLRALDYREQKKLSPPARMPAANIIGSSEALQQCLRRTAMAADSDAAVLIEGETGTGKELIARAIHDGSSRANQPFVVVDCGALPENLLEAELFGHAKGAFTGANMAREGLVSLADKGTLFLDEVGELPLSQQRSFLRVLQEKSFRPLGGGKEQTSDFRLLAATNKNLDAMSAAGGFREDLLFRLRTISINLPPLRDRKEDIVALATFQMECLCARYSLPSKQLTEDFIETLEAYNWPGNVRELFSSVERAMLAGKHEASLYATHLPAHLRVAKVQGSLPNTQTHTPPTNSTVLYHAPHFAADGSLLPWRDVREQGLEHLENVYLQDLMKTCEGNVTRAAGVSGLSRQRLHELLRKHGIVRNDF